MKYAATNTGAGGRETVLLTLPLSAVPAWDPLDPCPGTSPVPDEAEAGWVRDTDAPLGWAPPPPPTPAEVQEQYAAAVQARLDAFARTRGYDGIVAACTYATSKVGAYKAEGRHCAQLRDATWQAFYALVNGAGAETPALEDILAALPPLEWPGEN